MCRLTRTCVLIVLLAIIASAQPPADTKSAPEGSNEPGRVPVKRVVLYKSGVGYFEHSARVRGTQELNIGFTTAQLNDVLNSLTVVDLGKGRISGVRFNSVAPLEERLRALRLPLGEDTSRADFLNALRGTRVEVSGEGTPAAGRLLSVETQKKITDPRGSETEVLVLSLVTDNGELHSFEVQPGMTVRIADRDLSEEVSRYLNLIASARAQDLRRMTISAAGEGERDIFVSYISEAPVWKSTYRILLPDKAGDKALMQGWAIVDNTTSEDWNDVRLSLVAGAPQSFIQEISQPYYAHRPVVPMPQALTLTPQTHEAAMMKPVPAPPPPPPGEGQGVGGGAFTVTGTMTANLQGVVKDPTGAAIPNALVTARHEATGALKTTRTDDQGHYVFYNLPSGNSTLVVEAPGFRTFTMTNINVQARRMSEASATLNVGTVAETVTVSAAAPRANLETAELSSAMEEEEPEAEAKGVGDLFEYDIKQNVTIGKNQSALVPILQAHVDAEKVTVWNDDSEAARRALWLTNTSGETLDGGTFNVLESETFAGEGLLEAVHQGERRLISYAADPAVRIKMEEESSDKPVSKVVIIKGMMTTIHEQREKKTYKISNSDVAARQVVIEHPARSGWKLADNLKPEESTPSFHRFKVQVGPKQSADLAVEEYHPKYSQVALTNLTSDFVAVLTKQQRVTPAMERVFRRILDQKNGIAGLEAQLNARQHEIEEISNDQARIRENMKALKGSAEEKTLVQRYTGQLNAQEDRLAALRSQIASLREKHQQAQEALDQVLNEITLTETF